MSWIRRNPTRLDPEVLERKADESIEKTRSQQGRVNRINNFLVNRNTENGFGTDFEYTLRPKEA